ncbi:hypothetical protein TWF281_003447 [Arthrobotrys megalospora]
MQRMNEEGHPPPFESPQMPDPLNNNVYAQESRPKCSLFPPRPCKKHGQPPKNPNIQTLPNCDDPNGYYKFIESGMRGILRIICTSILHVYDLQCQSSTDKAEGRLIKLIKNLEYEDNLAKEICPGPNGTYVYKLVFDEKTINRLIKLSFRYPVYNRLFETLRILDLTLEQWCVIRGVFANGDYGFHHIPFPDSEQESITIKFQKVAGEYAEHFFKGLSVCSRWTGILVGLAKDAGEIVMTMPVESAEQNNTDIGVPYDIIMQQDGPAQDGNGDLYMATAANPDGMLGQYTSGEFEGFTGGDQSFLWNGQNPTEYGLYNILPGGETVTGTDTADQIDPSYFSWE